MYLCRVDGEGNMVSYIQSNYMGFGSGVVVTGTGVALQRRGHDIRCELSTPAFGRGQMIVRLENGILVGGTESRTDSNIACY